MKRVKGLFATIMILTILMGNFVWASPINSEVEATYTGGFTTQEYPDPVRE